MHNFLSKYHVWFYKSITQILHILSIYTNTSVHGCHVRVSHKTTNLKLLALMSNMFEKSFCKIKIFSMHCRGVIIQRTRRNIGWTTLKISSVKHWYPTQRQLLKCYGCCFRFLFSGHSTIKRCVHHNLYYCFFFLYKSNLTTVFMVQ